MSLLTLDYSFGGTLKKFRLSQDITIRKMAKLIDMDAGNYCKIENGTQPPPNSRSKVFHLIDPLLLQEHEREILVKLAYWYHLNKFKNKWHVSTTEGE